VGHKELESLLIRDCTDDSTHVLFSESLSSTLLSKDATKRLNRKQEAMVKFEGFI
jgi:hypothetical protein